MLNKTLNQYLGMSMWKNRHLFTVDDMEVIATRSAMIDLLITNNSPGKDEYITDTCRIFAEIIRRGREKLELSLNQ